MHQREAIGRRDQHFGRARRAMRVRILARLVDVEVVMGVLDRRHAPTARSQARDHAREQRGLARAAPAGDADHFHAATITQAGSKPNARTQYSERLWLYYP